jgi:hypothetical protein
MNQIAYSEYMKVYVLRFSYDHESNTIEGIYLKPSTAIQAAKVLATERSTPCFIFKEVQPYDENIIFEMRARGISAYVVAFDVIDD